MKRKFISAAIILILLFNILPGAFAYESAAKLTIREAGVDGAPKTMFGESALKGTSDYPEYYSSVDMGYTPGIKNQQSTELCWTFTQNNLLETNIKKNTGMQVDYSEQAMKFETSNSTDLENGFRRGPNDGGNETMSIAYLARAGSVYESDEPFSTSVTRTAVSPARHGYLKSAPMCVYDTSGYNEQAILKIKQLVADYGAAGAGIFFSQSYEDKNKENYYYPVSGVSGSSNHEVTVVGWDDNYSKNNFVKTPAGDGAFIIKNSYGLRHNGGTSDLCYVSYYDKFICSEVFSSEYELENDLFNNVYSYDDGWAVSIGFNGYESAYYGMKFKSESQVELLTAVGTYITEPYVNAHVMINTSSNDRNDAGGYRTVCSKYFKDPGYYTMEFEPEKLPAGDFFVVIKIDSPKNYPSFPVQYYDAADTNLMVCAENIPNTSFAGVELSNMSVLEKSFPDNRIMGCIKAYTMQADGPVPEKCRHLITTTVNKVESNCILQGHDEYVKCDICKEIISGNDALLPYGQHSWGEWTVTKPATLEEEGIETRVCKNDHSHTETRPLAKLLPPARFSDVPETAFYANPVQWAVANNITNGTGADTFSPNNKCTREQVVTFLWRAAGTPEPTSTTNPFKDVKQNDYFYKAVLWAVEKGVTSGTSSVTFSPKSECTRAQVVTFLWRANGQTEPDGDLNPFTDVQSGAYYCKAILWAIENSITNGTSSTAFSPNSTCSRGQVVTFLYRSFSI